MSSEVSSGCSVRSRPTSQTSTDTLTCEDLPMGDDSQDMPPPTSSHSHYHRRITRQSQHQYLLRAPSGSCNNRTNATIPREPSPVSESFGVSDYDASDPVEHHSSEEELETLTGSWGRESGPSEKRKWSQVARLSLTDSGSSDDEVCVLTTGTRPPVEFRTSPPLEAHKPLRSISPPSKMLTLSSSSSQRHLPQLSMVSSSHSSTTTATSTREENIIPQGAEGGTVISPLMNGSRSDIGVRATSPRKRHRHTPRPYRPHLDFEKMQQHQILVLMKYSHIDLDIDPDM
ncbi:hypothetical protein Avbf_03584 [Armadillidium vulgare]|nr:hypothetical protein Avbf_03584 [Armadillidium vulgare]